MKSSFLTLFVLTFLTLFCGCQTDAEKEIARLTLPPGHPLPRIITEGTPQEAARHIRTSSLSVNSRNASGVPLLILAAARGDTAMIRFLLEEGADKEIADLNGCRALHAAASCNHAGAVELLLQQGADINAPGSYGRTPLMEAARTARVKIGEILLRKGADINGQDSEGRTALMHGASAAGDEPEFLKLLLKNGADPAMADTEGRTALMHGALRNNARCALLLLKDLPDFTNEREACGLLILKCAIDGRNQELVKALIRKKVPLNWDQSLAHNILERVKLHGIYRIFVRQGVLAKKRSPLMWAALNNDPGMIKLLLDSGADPIQEDENGNTAYDLASERRCIAMLKKAENEHRKKLQGTKKKRLFRSKMFR